VEEHGPTVALIDVKMGRGVTGIEVTRRIRRSSPHTAALLYTSYADRTVLVEALDAGARGYVLKGAPLEELVRAVRLVAGGGSYVDGALVPTLAGASALDRAPQLTEREREVLRLLAEGMRNEEIGRRLYISPETVKAHVAKAMRKLDADTRTQAVAEALRHAIIS
jgi:two-component system, NarL family, response regulator